jgi:hypothetical protein
MIALHLLLLAVFPAWADGHPYGVAPSKCDDADADHRAACYQVVCDYYYKKCGNQAFPKTKRFTATDIGVYNNCMMAVRGQRPITSPNQQCEGPGVATNLLDEFIDQSGVLKREVKVKGATAKAGASLKATQTEWKPYGKGITRHELRRERNSCFAAHPSDHRKYLSCVCAKVAEPAPDKGHAACVRAERGSFTWRRNRVLAALDATSINQSMSVKKLMTLIAEGDAKMKAETGKAQ